jgi:hypothetical protein
MKMKLTDFRHCKTADDVAELLRKEGFYGVPMDPEKCPLAEATGLTVFPEFAIDGEKCIPLSAPLREFVRGFDEGKFRYLQIKEAQWL